MASKVLKIGDEVSLFSDKDDSMGFLAADGFSEQILSLKNCTTLQNVPEFEDAIFEIHTMKNFTKLMELKDLVDQKGVGEGSGGSSRSNMDSSTKTYFELKKKTDSEAKHNDVIQERALGRFIVYGEIVSFMHKKSGKFLRVDSDKLAPKGPRTSGLAVSLDDEDGMSHFRIIPRYKLHAEGQQIHLKDYILLQHIKTHQVVTVDGNIVTAVSRSDETAGLQIRGYSSYDSPETKENFLNAGEIVRIYNKEEDGFLSVESVDSSGGNVFPHLYAHRSGEESSSTLFIIEKERNTYGGYIDAKENVKLRHFGTGLYLDASKSGITLTTQLSADSVMFQLVNFYSFAAKGNIEITTTFRVYSPHLKQYLFVLDEEYSALGEPGEDEKKKLMNNDDDMDGDEESGAGFVGTQALIVARKKINMSHKLNDEDTFVLVRASRDDMDNLNAVRSLLPVFHEYLQHFKAETFEPKPKLVQQMHSALTNLIFFVQEAPSYGRGDLDPMEFEGNSINPRQKVCREQGLLDLLFLCQAAPFEPTQPSTSARDSANRIPVGQAPLSWEDLSTIRYRLYHRTIVLTYRLIKVLVRDNDENRQHLSSVERVDFILAQATASKGTLRGIDTLMEICLNNMMILEKFPESAVHRVADLITVVGKTKRYMGLLAALQECEKEAIPNNQKLVCEMLLQSPRRNDCIIETRFVKGEIQVDLETTKKIAEISGQNWVSLDEFTKRANNEVLEYYVNQILCFAKMCTGRNVFCIDIVSKLLPYDMCFAAVSNTRLSEKGLTIRAAYMKVLKTIYIDVDPNKIFAQVTLTRMWKRSAREIPCAPGVVRKSPPATSTLNIAHRKSFFGPSRRTAAKGSSPSDTDGVELLENAKAIEESTASFAFDLTLLQELLLDIIAEARLSKPMDMPRNIFIKAALDLMHELIRLGFYSSVWELDQVMEKLLHILDDRNSDNGDPDRFKVTSNKVVYMECKRAIIGIFETIAKLRGDYRLSMLLILFEEKIDSNAYGDIAAALHKRQEVIRRASGNFLVQGLTAGVQNIINVGGKVITAGEEATVKIGTDVADMLGFDMTKKDPEIDSVFMELAFPHDLVPVLLDCMQYRYPPLKTRAIGLLISNFSQLVDSLKALQQTQLLISKENELTYQRVVRALDTIMNRISVNMSPDSERIVLEALVELEGIACDPKTNKPSPTNQQILRSMDAQDYAHRLLHLPYTAKPDMVKQELGRRNILLSCYRFLKNFAMFNPSNQTLLLPHVSFYISQMGAKLKAADTITEIFRGNRQVCSQIDEDVIRQFCKIISEKGRFPRYCKLLQTLVRPAGRPLQRNQELLIKFILEMDEGILRLYSDELGMNYRDELIAKKENAEPEGKLNYHIALVELLGMIAEGQSPATNKCQTLLPLPNCMDHLRHNLPLFIKRHFIKFVHEAFFRVEKPPSRSVHKSILEVVGLIPKLLDECCSGDQATERAEVMRTVEELCNLISTAAVKTIVFIPPTEWKPELFVKIAETLSRAIGILPFSTHVNAHSAAKATIEALQGSNISDKLKSFEFTPLGAALPIVDKRSELPSQEAVIKNGLDLFITDFRIKTGLASMDGTQTPEFWEMVSLFKDDNPKWTIDALPWTSARPDDFPLTGGNLNVFQLVNHIVNGGGDTDLKASVLRMLEKLATFEDDNVTMVESQNRLDKLGEFTSKKFRDKLVGATRMVLKMMVDPRHRDVLKEVLAMGAALLRNGNKSVQVRIFQFSKGDTVIFFERLRDLIRKGVEEVDDIIQYNQRVREMRAASEGMSSMDLEESLPKFTEQAHMLHLLEFIRLTCEGHNSQMQDLWRQQNARHSYDIVTEIVEYLVKVEVAGIDAETVDRAIKTLQTLTELMQGPNVGNQIVLSASKLCQTCDKILLMTGVPRATRKQEADLKEETAKCLAAILEGCRDKSITNNVSSDIHMATFVGVLKEAYEARQTAKHNKEADQSAVNELLETAFEVFMFLLTLADHNPAIAEEIESKLNADIYEYFDSRVGKIEINQHDELRRVYFRKPPICKNLTDDAKDSLLWAVDRSATSRKLQDFMTTADDLNREMRHRERLTKNRLSHLLTNKYTMEALKIVVGVLSLVINIYMLMVYVTPDEAQIYLDSSMFHRLTTNKNFLAIWILGVIQAGLEVIAFAGFIVGNSLLIILKGIDDPSFGDPREILENGLFAVAGVKKLGVYFVALYYLVINKSFLVRSCVVCTSILGILVTPMIFSINLLIHSVEISKDLQNVLRSVTQNGRSLLITAVFGVFLVYLLSLWAFHSLSGHYNFDNNGDTTKLCGNLLQCSVVTLSSGLRNGDIGAVLNETDWGDPEFILFALVYFALITTIMLNVIFGIIIDTFSELREDKLNTENDIENRCFICALERFAFEKYPGGFEKHIKKEHNMWEYLFFLVHINEKDPNNYTGPESYVRSKLDNKDVSWFPVGKAIALFDEMKREEEAQNFVRNLVSSVDTRSKFLQQQNEQLTRMLETLEKKLFPLTEDAAAN